MGGGSYDRSVYSYDDSSSTGNSYTRSSSSSFKYSKAAERDLNASTLNTSLFPKNRTLTCTAETGIVIVLDHTGSMGDAAKVIYDKQPMFYGQIEQKGYLRDFAISFGAVGDVNSDEAPLQVCNFAQGLKLDESLKKIYLEGGGGGQTMESYELMALYYLRHAEYTHSNAQKPFMFIIGDEAFYDRIDASDVKRHIGDSTKQLEQASRKIFEELREKYHCFMLHIPYQCRPDPDDSKGETVVSAYPSTDREICRKWKDVFREDFLVVKEPKAIVDVILGCIAMVGNTRSLDEYVSDMKDRGQTKARIERVKESLSEVSRSLALRPDASIAAANKGLDRGGKSTRL